MLQRRNRPGDTAVQVLTPLLAAFGALVVAGWDLTRPALWLDETATTVAAGRSWPHLALMLRGSDAPLVPYYAVVKVGRGLAVHLVPPVQGHLEVLVRWPSVAATVLAVGLLTRWLQRVASPAVALAAAAVLLLTVGVSRYAQEARPYALVLCLAVVATLTWWRTVVDGRRTAVPLYTLAVAGLALLHVMALLLVPAQLVAAGVLPAGSSPLTRRRRVLTVALGGLAGALLASPFTVPAVLHGQGATRFAGLSGSDLASALASLLSSGSAGLGFVVPALVLAVLGALDRSALARLATAWAVVPPVVFVAAVAVRPNLLIPRYLLFTLPAWAILVALGLARVVAPVARVVGRPWRPATAAALMTAVIVGLGLVQGPVLAEVRTPAGHGEDIRPSLAAAGRPSTRGLPIYVGPAHDGLEVQAYAPGDVSRLVDSRPQSDQAPVWPDGAPLAAYRTALRSRRELIVILRHGSVLPNSLLRRRFHVVSELPHGRGWVTYLAVRASTG